MDLSISSLHRPMPKSQLHELHYHPPKNRPMRHRQALYLSDAMTHQLELTAEARHVSKSAILEQALRQYLIPPGPSQSSGLSQLQQSANGRSLSQLQRELAVSTELLATLTRFFLTVTPPMPEGEQAAARTLGRLRFEQVIEDVSRRLRTDRSLMERVEARLRETVQKTSPDKPGQDADHASTTSQCVPGGPSEIDRDA